MKYIGILFAIVFSSQSLFAFSGGNGTVGSPYQISSIADLNEIRNHPDDNTLYFIQTSNIDLSSVSDWQAIFGVDGSQTFAGTYDGNGKVIKNLTQVIDNLDPFGGLFGAVSGTIKNLGVVNINITGVYTGSDFSYIGGLAAGTVDVSSIVTIQNCYTTGSINFQNNNNGTCYVGGLIGDIVNSGSPSVISNCYSHCSITVSGNANKSVGGFIGSIDYNLGSSIQYCYSAGAINVSGNNSYFGGFCGPNAGVTITDCYYDQTTSGQSDNDGRGTPKTTAAMQPSTSYSGSWTSANWSFVNGSYPKLVWQVPVIQASSINFTSVTSTSMTISCTAGDGSRRAFFVKQGTGTITNPSDGVTYTASADWSAKGTQLGSSGYYCVYAGTGNSVTLNNLSQTTQYTVQIFEYDGTTATKYLTTTESNNPKSQTTLTNPIITSVSPTYGPTAGGTSVVINGANFSGTTAVKFGLNNAAGYTVNSATQITALSPSGTAGNVAITVVTPAGEVVTGSIFHYYPLPVITSISPSFGSVVGGTSVVLMGINLGSATSVKFGSVNATGFTINSDSQITVTSPAGTAGYVDITVTTLGGTSVTGFLFYYYELPTITGISPSFGLVAGGTSVVITGTNLGSATAVKFGSTNATSYTVNSDTKITATSPAVTAGTVDITVTTAGGTSATSSADQFTYLTPGTWIGITSSDWNTASNWAGGSVPTSSTDVVIPATPLGGFLPFISETETADCNNLTTANGMLEILSSASGTGSLIVHGTASGKVWTNRYFTGSLWHLVAPQVDGTDINSFILNGYGISSKVSGGTTTYAIADYNEGGNVWNSYFTNTTSGTFDLGKGYLMRGDNNTSVGFYGSLATGTKMVGLTKTGEGWNCIGNPYPSAINMNTEASAANNFLKTNAIDNANIDPSYCVYVWDDGSKTYKVLNNVPGNPRDPGINVFASGQAFFVKANGAASSVQFMPQMQVHSTAAVLKSAEVPWASVALKAASEATSSTALVYFHEGMTAGLDVTYDAGLLRGSSGLSVYTKLINDNGVDFAIQCLPEIGSDQFIIPVGLDAKAGGELKFSVTTEGLPVGCKVVLEDRVAKSYTDLTNGASYPVSISANAGGTGRFYLHLSNLTTGISELLPEGLIKLKAYPSDEKIIIDGKVTGNAVASLFATGGNLIGRYNLAEGESNSIPASGLASGVYILKVVDGGNIFTSKLVLVWNK